MTLLLISLACRTGPDTQVDDTDATVDELPDPFGGGDGGDGGASADCEDWSWDGGGVPDDASGRGLELWDEDDLPGCPIVATAPGDAHLCVLDSAGEIHCWGPRAGDEKDLGQQLAPSGQFKAIEAGFFHTCALDMDGYAHCWGDDTHGQSTPPDDLTFSRLELGSGVSCGITEFDGRILCWGMGNYLSEAPAGNDWAELDLDIWAGCAVAIDGQLACWGNTEEGDKHNTGQVEDAPTGTGWASVGMGQYHACVVGQDHSIECWGNDEEGQSTPPEGVDFTYAEAGDRHGCGLDTDGIVHCWGTDGIIRPTPENQELTHLASSWTFLSGVKPDGTLYLWGQENPYNSYMPGWVPDDMKF